MKDETRFILSFLIGLAVTLIIVTFLASEITYKRHMRNVTTISNDLKKMEQNMNVVSEDHDVCRKVREVTKARIAFSKLIEELYLAQNCTILTYRKKGIQEVIDSTAPLLERTTKVENTLKYLVPACQNRI